MANAAKIGNPNSIKSLEYFEGLTQKYIAFSYFYQGLSPLPAIHEMIFETKITLNDLAEYSVLKRNLPR